MNAAASSSVSARPRSALRRLTTWALMLLIALYLGTAAWQQLKPLPEGLALSGPWQSVGQIEFLSDTTWLDARGEAHSEQQIFDAALTLIAQARDTIVTDFFLVNAFAGQTGDGHRALSSELIQALGSTPQARAVLISDPLNTLYGGISQPLFSELEQAQGETVITDLTRLRDSNPLYSSAWRICCQWFGNRADSGRLPNPVGGEPVTLRSWLTLLNFKANHRKTLVVQTDQGARALVTSANPHDASSRHSNVAVLFDGPAVADLLESERAAARMSGADTSAWPALAIPPPETAVAELRVLTEGAIRDAALEMIDSAQAGDSVDLLMFYLSQRSIVQALIEAHSRGVEVRVLLDPNEDAFGRKKDGVPNRPVAAELQRAGITVRWCWTQGEQCHGKMLVLHRRSGQSQMLAGSANFTRRNLDNYNLETSVEVRAATQSAFMQQITHYMDRLWQNREDQLHSRPWADFADESRLRYWRYRIMEASGLSTF